jgi:zinc/manganese transport system substrate-binding protein
VIRKLWIVLSGLVIGVFLFGCYSNQPEQNGQKRIVVTYSILGSLVKELVGDQADVTTVIPNGQDLHEWMPSARDIEKINNASLIVCNGLGLEAGLTSVLENAQKSGVKIFEAADYITIRHVGAGEGIPSDDPDQAAGAPDPHIWTDPVIIKAVVTALSSVLQSDLGLDTVQQAEYLNKQLDDTDKKIRETVSTIPQENRKLVTGHESLGYFAQRYSFKLIGAVIPNLSTQAGVSAANMAALKTLILENQVKVVFTELGTPAADALAISQETGVKVVELNTHILPEDGQYTSFILTLTQDISQALK